MKKHFPLILFYFTFSFIINANAQISGCTDPQSNNYNPSPTENNGTCTYNTTNLTITDKTPLSTPLLDEDSGIEFLDGKLWTHNDSNNPNDIYRVGEDLLPGFYLCEIIVDEKITLFKIIKSAE